MNAPAGQNDFAARLDAPQFPVFAAGAGRGAIETAAFKIFDADGAILRIEEDARRQRIVFDFERMLLHRLEHALARAAPPAGRGRKRDFAQALAELPLRAPIVRINLADDNPRQPLNDAAQPGLSAREWGLGRAEEIGPDRFADHGHQSDVRERLRRQRPLHGQPAIPAVPGRIDEPAGQPEEQPPDRAVTAILDALEIAAHVFGPPGGVAGQLGDGVPVRVVRGHEDHRVVRGAAAERRGARVEDAGGRDDRPDGFGARRRRRSRGPRSSRPSPCFPRRTDGTPGTS